MINTHSTQQYISLYNLNIPHIQWSGDVWECMVYGKWRWRLWCVKSGKVKRTLHWSSKWFFPHRHTHTHRQMERQMCILQLFGLEQIFLQFPFENLLFEILQYFVALNRISFWHWCRNEEEEIKTLLDQGIKFLEWLQVFFCSFIIANPSPFVCMLVIQFIYFYVLQLCVECM